MQHGNWIPISKAFTKYLPKDRPYTEFEAAYCLQVDYDNNKKVTITGYADLWRWSKKRVYRFLDRLGVKIIYPDNTQKCQNQRGLITLLIRDRKETDKRLIRFIDSRCFVSQMTRKETDKGLKRDRSGNATINPNTDPKPNPKKYILNSNELRLANVLYELILQNDPKAKKPNLQNWADEIHKINSLDNRSFEEIENVIRWCQQDDFWHTNVLSPGKLRKQFPQLILKMKGNVNGKNWDSNRQSIKYKRTQPTKNRKYSHLGTSVSPKG